MPKLKVTKVPAQDTGIGREAGYKDDADLIAAYEAERAALPPAVRETVDKLDAEMMARFVNGDKDA